MPCSRDDGSLTRCPSSCNITAAEIPLTANTTHPRKELAQLRVIAWSPVRVRLIHKVPVIAVQTWQNPLITICRKSRRNAVSKERETKVFISYMYKLLLLFLPYSRVYLVAIARNHTLTNSVVQPNVYITDNNRSIYR